VLCSDPFELLERSLWIHWDVGAGPRRELQVALENRGTGAWINLLETHRFAATTMAENRLPPSCADVGHPVHVLAEHRHEIALALVVGDNHRERSAPATKPRFTARPELEGLLSS
jgi:hypothetical protein